MDRRIEDYALIGDMQTAALVCRDGTADWLCLPRFDSPAVFAGLLGTDDHGLWRIGPAHPTSSTPPAADRRHYRGESLILESEWDTPTGTVRVTDFMPPRRGAPQLIRVVEGISGRVPMRSQLRLRFGYGRVVPRVDKKDGLTVAVAGPDSVWLDTSAQTYGKDLTTYADFTVSPGERVAFTLSWQPSHKQPPPLPEPEAALEATEQFWRKWAGRCTYQGAFREAVIRSLITLKALTYAPTGGIVAAPTTSLPEDIGGVRNWDYRYTWLRDAAITLSSLLRTGYREEARAWREWLLRAVAGDPENLQIMYGIAGERELGEAVLDWLPGYENSVPVRVGNAAAHQLQLDVYGEVAEVLHLAAELGLEREESTSRLLVKLIACLETCWDQPDEGIWEVRGPRRHFVHSKVMAWVAVDRTIKLIESGDADGPIECWRNLRDEIHQAVCEKGYDPQRNTFTQSYGSTELDASLLLIPQVGFLPPDDKRVIGTIEAIQRELSTPEGFVRRYPTASDQAGLDGLEGDEGAFLACSFWLAHDLALIGRVDEARRLFDKLLALRNDLGLLAEEWDPRLQRQVGNFPQAFSHVGLVHTALALTPGGVPRDPGLVGFQIPCPFPSGDVHSAVARALPLEAPGQSPLSEPEKVRGTRKWTPQREENQRTRGGTAAKTAVQSDAGGQPDAEPKEFRASLGSVMSTPAPNRIPVPKTDEAASLALWSGWGAGPEGNGARGRRGPTVARVVNYLTGGSDNYSVDRDLANNLLKAAPWLPNMIEINQQHGPRAVVTMARERGIRQFLDLGCGLPSQWNREQQRHDPLHTYEAASSVHGSVRVVYVDNDSVVAAHARMILAEPLSTAAIQADICQIGELLNNPAVRALDRTKPIAVLAHDLLPWVSDEAAEAAMVALRAWLPAGSAISVTHASSDREPEAMTALVRRYVEAGIAYRPRPLDHIRALLGPWAPLPPGIVPTVQWRVSNLPRLPYSGHSFDYAAIVTHPDPW